MCAQEKGRGEGLVGLLAEKMKMALLPAEKEHKRSNSTSASSLGADVLVAQWLRLAVGSLPTGVRTLVLHHLLLVPISLCTKVRWAPSYIKIKGASLPLVNFFLHPA